MIDAAKRPIAKEILGDPWLDETQMNKIVRSHSN